MSLAEIVLILGIGLCILKPSDIKIIAKTIRDIISYINKLKNEIFSAIDEESGLTTKEQERINLYLSKIIHLSGKYEGEYNLPSVKAYYHKLLLKQHSDNL